MASNYCVACAGFCANNEHDFRNTTHRRLVDLGLVQPTAIERLHYESIVEVPEPIVIEEDIGSPEPSTPPRQIMGNPERPPEIERPARANHQLDENMIVRRIEFENTQETPGRLSVPSSIHRRLDMDNIRGGISIRLF